MKNQSEKQLENINTLRHVSYKDFGQRAINETLVLLADQGRRSKASITHLQQALVIKDASPAKSLKSIPSIEYETRTHVGTDCAAFWLGRKNQTLRSWACLENGPLRPHRINGRLAWAVADIRKLLNGGG